jgi:hypothetical protein
MEYLLYIIDSFIRIIDILMDNMDNLPSNLTVFINSIKYLIKKCICVF